MNAKKLLLSLALTIIICTVGYSHALWIETNPVGKKGVSQEVKIFYGEYSENSPEKVADWFSDVKEFTIWLAVPGKEKVKLEVTATENHFVGKFTPDADGAYTLFISHEAKNLGGKTKYQFNASAVVNVGAAKQNVIAANANPLKFSIDKPSVNKPVTINTVFNNAPAEKFSTMIFSPKGWTMEVHGKEGTAQFNPEWKGKYMVEVSNTTPEKGEHHGAAYESVWRCATSLVDVN